MLWYLFLVTLKVIFYPKQIVHKCNIHRVSSHLCFTSYLWEVWSILLMKLISELKWSGGWSTGTIGWFITSEGSVPGRVAAMNAKRLVPLPFREPFAWLTRNTVTRVGRSRIDPAVLTLHAAGVGLIGRPAVFSGRYNKCHSLQLQNHGNTHTYKHNYADLVMGNDHGFQGTVCCPWQE